MTHIEAKVMMIALVVVASHHCVGGSITDHRSKQDACFGLKKYPTLTHAHYPHVAVPCGSTCTHCSTGINFDFPCIAGVLGDTYTIGDSIVNNGMIFPDGVVYNVVN